MRALVSILCSVVLLAIIQASYIAASGSVRQTREQRKEGKHHHSDTSSHHHPHEKTGHHEHQKKNHRDTEHADMKKLYHDPEKKHKQMKQEKSVRPVVPPYFEIKDKHHNRYETQEDEAVFPTRKVNVRVERVEVHHAPKTHESKSHESQAVVPKDRASDVYGHMQGDEPVVEHPNEQNAEENQDKRKRNKKNKNKKNKKKSKSEKKQSAPSGKKEKKHQKSNTCERNVDCNGGCCVPKKGRKVCKKANFRDLGEKCASSCVCNEGMKCFVSDYKRNGQKKVRKPGKRILGRCVNLEIADETKGYFIEENVPE